MFLTACAFMAVGAFVDPPHGFVRLCERSPAMCQRSGEVGRVILTPEKMEQLKHTTKSVNESTTPATDLETHGEDEVWGLPVDGKGDCEDYALLKQRVLVTLGWPSSALLLTVVMNDKGEGHAVLTVRTDKGDFALDNMNDNVLLWDQVPYAFQSRQSYLNPTVWISVEDGCGLAD